MKSTDTRSGSCTPLTRRVGAALAACLSAQTALALEQTNKAPDIRPYVHMRSGEYDTVWGVQDEWGFGVGMDFSRHVSLELAFDSYEKDFDPFGTKVGEQSLLALVPQVRLRLPLVNDRVVPYVLAGAGVGWYDFNDPLQHSPPYNVDAQGTELVISGGVGVDLFINETVAFNLEWKYIWLQDLGITVDGASGTFQMADFVGTFGFRAYLDRAPNVPLAEAQEQAPIRLYFGAGWGGAVLTDSDWVPGVSLSHEVSSLGTVGQSVELALGFNFARHFGFEFAVDYWEGNINLDNVAGVSGGVGEYAVYAAIPNLRFRWPMQEGRFVPYLLAGAGATYSEVNDRFDNGSGVTVNSKGFAPACSVGGGVEYFFNRNVSLFGQTKWIYSWDRKVDVNNTGDQTGDNSWLHFQIGFRLYLLDIGGSR